MRLQGLGLEEGIGLRSCRNGVLFAPSVDFMSFKDLAASRGLVVKIKNTRINTFACSIGEIILQKEHVFFFFLIELKIRMYVFLLRDTVRVLGLVEEV